jgi:predicted acyl esterase
VAAAPDKAGAAEVPAGAEWTQATFPSSDGVRLHADILRPNDLPAGTRTPVILSVGPYFNHSGQVGAAGPVQDASYDPVGPAGPSDRFLDFIDGAQLMERGYTFVMVDIRGFGGSTGCHDLYRYLYGDGIRRYMPTLPVDHGCVAAHFTELTTSACSPGPAQSTSTRCSRQRCMT